MTAAELAKSRALQGRTVGVALEGGERLDGCRLMSLPRHGNGRVWVFADGHDVMVPARQIIAIWE